MTKREKFLMGVRFIDNTVQQVLDEKITKEEAYEIVKTYAKSNNLIIIDFIRQFDYELYYEKTMRDTGGSYEGTPWE